MLERMGAAGREYLSAWLTGKVKNLKPLYGRTDVDGDHQAGPGTGHWILRNLQDPADHRDRGQT